MKISVGCDHGGYELKEYLVKNLSSLYEVIDEGCYSKDSVDYPLYAEKVAKDLISGKAEQGILICTNGVGISIAANKFKGIRAALCVNADMANHAKNHNDANIICLGGTNQPFEEALEMVKVFLETNFTDEERHVRRVNQIKRFEEI